MKNQKISPEVATLRVTSRCTRDCKHCFAPKDVPEMLLSSLKKIFCLLVANGVRSVLLTGGEPLLRQDFREIILQLKRHGLRIFLDTNGDSFSQYRNLICRNVDTIGLPINFPNRSYGEGNFENVMRVLEYLARSRTRPLIRIGTVVTRDNIGELEEVGDLINAYPISIWKLYQFTPQEKKAIANRRLLEVDEEEFDIATEKVKEEFSGFFDVTISKRTDRNRAYFLIEPDGRVAMPVDNMDVCRLETIGNIFEADIFKKWAEWISEDCYRKNAKSTFKNKQ
jgi:MoaA/NifB/PqqE/SkfB family radical SAM enzyme